jgi:hypothetical protein
MTSLSVDSAQADMHKKSWPVSLPKPEVRKKFFRSKAYSKLILNSFSVFTAPLLASFDI